MKKIRILLLLITAVAAIRLAYVFYERSWPVPEPKTRVEGSLDPDYYVVPTKLHAWDLKSARAIVGKPVWVREGYRWTYFPFDPARGRADFRHEAGLLGPLERLEAVAITTGTAPQAPGYRQVLLVFVRAEKSYAVPVGTESGGQFDISLDELFFYEDPHQLYGHWPADVWQAVDRHQVKLGMNELQVGFALGVGYLGRQTDSDVRTLTYPNGGNPLVVAFRNGRAAEIKPEQK